MGSYIPRLLIKIVGALVGLMILTSLVIWAASINPTNWTQQPDSSKVLAQDSCTSARMSINSIYSVYSSANMQQTPIAKTLANNVPVTVKRCSNGWVEIAGWFKIR